MSTTDDDVVIIGAARTPFGRLLGGLSGLSATDLGGHAIAAALERAGVGGDEVDAVILGEVLQAGVGQIPAKQAALAAGISRFAHTTTVNKVCLSGLQSFIDGSRMLRLGEADIVVVGGMESMSQAPHVILNSRRGTKYGPLNTVDHMDYDALTDAVDKVSMGALTEKARDTYPVSRREMDECAALSHQNAAKAWEEGRLDEEVVPVTVPGRKGSVTVDRDEGIRPDSTVESLGALRPAFAPDGDVTAGNASQITDGAAAAVLTTRRVARERGANVLAVLRSAGQTAGPDNTLQEQPATALKAALDREGWDAKDLDVVEINEAFAAVVVHSCRVLGIDPDNVNRSGGAIALGHPVGASGARLAIHAAFELAAGRGTKAGVSLCGGGGQGEALLLEADN